MLHRHARPAVAGAYTAGAVTGALVSSLGLLVIGGLLSPIPAGYRGVVAVCLLLLLAARELGIVCFDLPERRHQIPRAVFSGSPVRAAFRFAAELGTSMRTYVTTSAPYAVAVVVVLCLPDGLGPASLVAAATGIGFGLGRSRIVASQAWRRTIAVDHPRVWLRVASLLSIAVSLAVAIAFTAAS